MTLLSLSDISSVFSIHVPEALSRCFLYRENSSAMLRAASIAIFIGSTVATWPATSRILPSTNRASSDKYSGSPSPRTLYVCPKISTVVESFFSIGKNYLRDGADYSSRVLSRIPKQRRHIVKDGVERLLHRGLVVQIGRASCRE